MSFPPGEQGPQEENTGRAFGEHLHLGVSRGGGRESRGDPCAQSSRTDSKVGGPLGCSPRDRLHQWLSNFWPQIHWKMYFTLWFGTVIHTHNWKKCCRKQSCFFMGCMPAFPVLFCTLLCYAMLSKQMLVSDVTEYLRTVWWLRTVSTQKSEVNRQ